MLNYSYEDFEYLPGSPYAYETWNSDREPNNNKFFWYGPNRGGGGAFRTEWKSYLIAGLGYFWGRASKLQGIFSDIGGGDYTQYNNIYVDYNYRRSNNVSAGGGFIGAYGWFSSPSAESTNERIIEYYIVDDWFYDGQISYAQIAGSASVVKEIGSFIVDGAEYKIFQNTVLYKQPFGERTGFTQIFNVRQGRRTSGTISVTEHFKVWSKYLKLDNLIDVRFIVEVAFHGGNGYLDMSYLYLSQETNRRNIPAGTIFVN